jgi:hypothetical protein
MDLVAARRAREEHHGPKCHPSGFRAVRRRLRCPVPPPHRPSRDCPAKASRAISGIAKHYVSSRHWRREVLSAAD